MAEEPEAPRPRSGQRPFVPTDAQRNMVKALVAFGIPQYRIRQIIEGPMGVPIDDKTLRKHFAHELDIGLDEMVTTVAKSLYDAATKERGSHAVSAAQFLLERRGGAPWQRRDNVVFMLEDVERQIVRMRAELGIAAPVIINGHDPTEAHDLKPNGSGS